MPTTTNRSFSFTGLLNYLRQVFFRHTQFHLSNFVHLPFFIVGNPFTYLFSIPEVSRAHFCAVFPKPLPVPIRFPVRQGTLCPDTPVFVTHDVFLLHGRALKYVKSALMPAQFCSHSIVAWVLSSTVTAGMRMDASHPSASPVIGYASNDFTAVYPDAFA